jgi:hypothetical protein
MINYYVGNHQYNVADLRNRPENLPLIALEPRSGILAINWRSDKDHFSIYTGGFNPELSLTSQKIYQVTGRSLADSMLNILSATSQCPEDIIKMMIKQRTLMLGPGFQELASYVALEKKREGLEKLTIVEGASYEGMHNLIVSLNETFPNHGVEASHTDVPGCKSKKYIPWEEAQKRVEVILAHSNIVHARVDYPLAQDLTRFIGAFDIVHDDHAVARHFDYSEIGQDLVSEFLAPKGIAIIS